MNMYQINITISQDHKARLIQANKPKSASIYNSPGTDTIGTANPWQEVNVNPRRGEIRCSGKGQHLSCPTCGTRHNSYSNQDQILLSNKPCSMCETEMLYSPTRSDLLYCECMYKNKLYCECMYKNKLYCECMYQSYIMHWCINTISWICPGWPRPSWSFMTNMYAFSN